MWIKQTFQKASSDLDSVHKNFRSELKHQMDSHNQSYSWYFEDNRKNRDDFDMVLVFNKKGQNYAFAINQSEDCGIGKVSTLKDIQKLPKISKDEAVQKLQKLLAASYKIASSVVSNSDCLDAVCCDGFETSGFDTILSIEPMPVTVMDCINIQNILNLSQSNSIDFENPYLSNQIDVILNNLEYDSAKVSLTYDNRVRFDFVNPALVASEVGPNDYSCDIKDLICDNTSFSEEFTSVNKIGEDHYEVSTVIENEEMFNENCPPDCLDVSTCYLEEILNNSFDCPTKFCYSITNFDCANGKLCLRFNIVLTDDNKHCFDVMRYMRFNEANLRKPRDAEIILISTGDFLVKSRDENFIESLNESIGVGIADDKVSTIIVDSYGSEVVVQDNDPDFVSNGGYCYTLVKEREEPLLVQIMGNEVKLGSRIENEIVNNRKIQSSEKSTVETLKDEGASVNQEDSDFDTTQLAAGILVEEEHSDDFDVSKEIAKDHLAEDPKYYSKDFFPKEAKERLEDNLNNSLITNGYAETSLLRWIEQKVYKLSNESGYDYEDSLDDLEQMVSKGFFDDELSPSAKKFVLLILGSESRNKMLRLESSFARAILKSGFENTDSIDGQVSNWLGDTQFWADKVGNDLLIYCEVDDEDPNYDSIDMLEGLFAILHDKDAGKESDPEILQASAALLNKLSWGRITMGKDYIKLSDVKLK